MKEHVLQLLEELVGAHTLRAKQEKADEIAALIKTAVFPADAIEDTQDRETAVWESAPVSAEGDIGNLVAFPGTVAPPADNHHD